MLDECDGTIDEPQINASYNYNHSFHPIMEGRGVTNYSTDKPSFAYSARTTEFDDALLERNIVTLEQVFMAKGASEKEAQRLAALKRAQDNPNEIEEVVTENKNDSNEESDIDDDEFLAQYRRQRLQELKKKSQGPYGVVVPISRQDWIRQVNDDSHKAWVVVTLTSHDVERTGCIEGAANTLAPKFPSVKFVTIPSTSAIADWPNENLPTIFLYRDGSLQKELIRLNTNITADELEWTLSQYGVVETELEEPPSPSRKESHSFSPRYGGSSIFGGSLAQLETRRNESDDDDSSEAGSM